MEHPPTAWRRAFAWPLWLLSPVTLRHDFNSNPVLGSPLLNRLGLHVLRLMLAHASTRLRWWLLGGLLPAGERRRFHRDGFLLLPDVLGEGELAALRAEVAAARGEFRECIQGDTLTHRLLLDDRVLEGMPVLRRLLNDPALTGALGYASAKNRLPLFYIQSIRNAVRSGRPDPQKVLHADTFHPTMKAWFFLEDVGAHQGPFTYVRGSQRLDWRRLRWEYRRSIQAAGLRDGYSEKGSFRFEEADLRELGLPPPESLAVAANTLLIANTFGVHCRGSALPGARRLEIWAYSRLNPFSPWPGLGLRWVSRLEQWKMKLWWRHLDREAARRGELSSWHPVSAAEFHAPTGPL